MYKVHYINNKAVEYSEYDEIAIKIGKYKRAEKIIAVFIGDLKLALSIYEATIISNGERKCLFLNGKKLVKDLSCKGFSFRPF